jgi:hypothetical protein
VFPGGVVEEHPAKRPKVTREVKRDWKRALSILNPCAGSVRQSVWSLSPAPS